MLPSPYTPGTRPRVFVGRQHERSVLREHLAPVVAYGESRPLTLVTGPRGLGKTSLLGALADQARQDGFVVAWSSGVKFQPFLNDALDEVVRELRRADVLDAPRSKHLKELTAELNLGIGKVQAKVDTTSWKEQSSAAGLLGPVEELLSESARAVRDKGGSGLLIVIDEIHAPLESRSGRFFDPAPQALLDAGVLLNVMQRLNYRGGSHPLAIIGAGLPQTKSSLTHAATFGERISEIVLSEFDSDTSEALLTEPAAQAGVSWEADALTLATRSAEGYPQALQVIGDATWKQARPEPGDSVSLSDVEASQGSVAEGLQSMFQARWSVATTSERAFVVAMARLQGEAVPRSAIAELLGTTSDAIGMVRQSLINKGVIAPDGHGRVRFTIPGFDRFVLEQGPDGD